MTAGEARKKLISSPRILFILPNLNGGGAERVAITYLRQLDLDRYDVTLAVFDKTQDLLHFVPEGVVLIDLCSVKTIKSFLPLLKLIRRLKPDVVFTTHSRVAALLLAIKPFTPNFRHLARMVNTPSLEKKHGEYGKMVGRLFAASFKRADVVIAQTEGMKEDAIDMFGIAAHKIAVLHNPMDADHIDEYLNLAESPFPDGQINVVASGRLDRQKGFDILLKALPKIILDCPDFHLYILGNYHGALQEIEALIDKLKISQYVDLVGFQENPYSYYANCDLFVLSSRWEGFPNALIENYYLNTPIVSTKCVPIIEQLINEGENGYLCEVEDSECLAKKILQGIQLKRENIRNNSYTGSRLEELFDV